MTNHQILAIPHHADLVQHVLKLMEILHALVYLSILELHQIVDQNVLVTLIVLIIRPVSIVNVKILALIRVDLMQNVELYITIQIVHVLLVTLEIHLPNAI